MVLFDTSELEHPGRASKNWALEVPKEEWVKIGIIVVRFLQQRVGKGAVYIFFLFSLTRIINLLWFDSHLLTVYSITLFFSLSNIACFISMLPYMSW